MADYVVQALTKQQGIEAAKEKLSASSRKTLETQFGEFQGLALPKLKELEKALINTFSNEDRFGNYQIFKLDPHNPDQIDKIAQEAANMSFLSNPSRLDWSVCPISGVPNKVAFAKHMISERRIEISEDSAAGTRVVSQVVPNDVLFYSEFEIIKTPNKQITLLVVKLPRYRRKLSQLYPFQDEVSYMVTWFSEKTGIKCAPLEIKKFFEDFKPHTYFDKSEFRISGLPSESGVVPVDMRIASLQSGLTNAYANLDKVLQTTLKTEQLKSFTEFVLGSNASEKDKVIALGTEFFSKFNFSSEEFFEVLHQTFEYGLGTITYTRGQEAIQYKLDYSENMAGLIRVSKLGWEVFEKLFAEITTFIDR